MGSTKFTVSISEDDLPGIRAAADQAGLTVPAYLARAGVRTAVRDAGTRYRAVLVANPDLAADVERLTRAAVDRGRRVRAAAASPDGSATAA